MVESMDSIGTRIQLAMRIAQAPTAKEGCGSFSRTFSQQRPIDHWPHSAGPSTSEIAHPYRRRLIWSRSLIGLLLVRLTASECKRKRCRTYSDALWRVRRLYRIDEEYN